MFPVGTDVSKDSLEFCILYDGIKGRIRTRKMKMTAVQQPISSAGFNYNIVVRRTFASLRKQPSFVTNGCLLRCMKLADTFLWQIRIAAAILPEARGMVILTKTDKVDAYMLVCYALLKLDRRSCVRSCICPLSVPNDVIRECAI